jgi:hypothetical protein
VRVLWACDTANQVLPSPQPSPASGRGERPSRKSETGKAFTLKSTIHPRIQNIMATTHPLDTNQIRARIGDLKERVASLRGYL